MNACPISHRIFCLLTLVSNFSQYIDTTHDRILIKICNWQTGIPCMQDQCPPSMVSPYASWHQVVSLHLQTMKFDARPTNPLLTEIIQARRLTLFGHITRMDDNVDTKQILTSLSLYNAGFHFSDGKLKHAFL